MNNKSQKDLLVENALKDVEKDVFDGKAINLSSFDIHDDLSREIWDENNRLYPDIRKTLLDIASDFIDTLHLDEIIDVSFTPDDLISDICFVGSLASFNYSKYSDIDLHVVIDLEPLGLDAPTITLFKKYFWQCKNDWNNNHSNLTVKGFSVELYVQDACETNAANGVYSVLNDKWVKMPKSMKDQAYDRDLVKQKALDYIHRIDTLEDLIKDDDIDVEKVGDIAKLIKDKIISSRRLSLNDNGNEMNVPNIIFKVLRRADYIGKLNNLINQSYDMKQTITERNDSDPISLKDVPKDFRETLEKEFNAHFYENDTMRLPYIYVDIPVMRENPASLIRKQGRPANKEIPNFNNVKKRRFQDLLKGIHWYLLELLRPDDVDSKNYCAIISPYKNPAEPGAGQDLDNRIERDRANKASREKQWIDPIDVDFDSVGGDSFYESTKVTLTFDQLKKIIKESI